MMTIAWAELEISAGIYFKLAERVGPELTVALCRVRASQLSK